MLHSHEESALLSRCQLVEGRLFSTSAWLVYRDFSACSIRIQLAVGPRLQVLMRSHSVLVAEWVHVVPYEC